MADLGDIGSTTKFFRPSFMGGTEPVPIFTMDSSHYDYANRGIYSVQGNITQVGIAKANAELLISKLEDSKVLGAKRTTTDALGNYSFAGLAPGDYMVMPVDRAKSYRSKVIHTNIPENTSAVSFVGETDVNNVVAGTIATAVPDTAQVGDLLIAFVFARSNTTAPTGWTRIVSSQLVSNSQRIEAFYKVAVISDLGTSPIFSQSNAAARMGISMHAYRKAGGCTVVAFNATIKEYGTGYIFESAPIANNGRLGNLIAIAQTSTFQGGVFQAVVPATVTQTTPQYEASGGNRMVVGYKPLTKKLESFTGLFNWDNTITTTSVASISLLIGQ